jgi:hypothetical protein
LLNLHRYSAGLFCSFLSSLMWMKPTKFAILYTVGNVLALGSTGFLTGFMSQVKGMFKGTRVIASCVYLGALVRARVTAHLSLAASSFRSLGRAFRVYPEDDDVALGYLIPPPQHKTRGKNNDNNDNNPPSVSRQ